MTQVTLKIGEHTIVLDDDVSTFTAAEMNAVERYAGLTMYEFGLKLGDPENISVLAWSALAWIGLRRAGTLTPYDEFMDGLKVTDLLTGIRSTDGEPLPDAVVPNRTDRRRAGGKAGAAMPPVRQRA